MLRNKADRLHEASTSPPSCSCRMPRSKTMDTITQIKCPLDLKEQHSPKQTKSTNEAKAFAGCEPKLLLRGTSRLDKFLFINPRRMQKEVIASGMGEGTSLGFHQHLGEKGENRAELTL